MALVAGIKASGEKGMEMKKTWLSYPLWLIYSIFTAMSAAAYFSWFSIYVWGFGQNQTAVWICLMFCAVAGIWFAGYKLAGLLGRRLVWRLGRGTSGRRLAAVLEALLVLGLCTAAVFSRLYLLFNFDGEITGGIFYDMALVRADGEIQWTVRGVSYSGILYTSFLSFVLSFTGNKAAAGAMLQLVLQVAAIFVFYFAGKLLAGRGEALCALGIMAFAPDLCAGILILTPEALYFLLYAFGLLLCGLYRKKSGSAAGRKKGYVMAIACGLYIGWVSLLDIAGWTLLAAMFLPGGGAYRRGTASLAGRQRDKDGKDKINRKNNLGIWGQWAVCALASLAAVFLLLGIHVRAYGYPYEEVLSAWLGYPARQLSLSAADIFWRIGAEPFSWMGLLICLCGTLNVIGFWPGKTQKQDCWILILLFLLVFQIFHIGGMEYGILLTAVEGVLAGIGLCSMGNHGNSIHPVKENSAVYEKICAEEEKSAAGRVRAEEIDAAAAGKQGAEEGKGAAVWKTVIKEGENAAAGKTVIKEEPDSVLSGKALGEEAGGAPSWRDMEEVYGVVDEKAWVEEKYDMAVANALEQTYTSTKEQARAEKGHGTAKGVNEELQEEKPKVKLLDNPLPLPRKHVKRVMTYAKDVEGDEMEFDFSVEESDDFDI